MFFSTSCQAKKLPERQVDHAPLNFTYLGVIFGHDVDHGPTYKLKAVHFDFLFLSERFNRNNDPKKIQERPKLVLKSKK